MSEPHGEWPESLLRYSALRYLQKRVTRRCAAHPRHFSSLDEWQALRVELVGFLKETLPIWEIADPRPARRTARIELAPDLVLEAVDVHFDEEFYIPVHVYQPAAELHNAAAVVVCPGYGQSKNAQDIVDACTALAGAGIVALAMEYEATGERADQPEAETDLNNVVALGELLGINNIGLRVMSNLAALTYLKGRGDVAPGRIGITGLCQGAIVTWFTAAVCEDFAAVAPLCGATTYEAIALEYCNRQGGWTGTSPYVFGMLAQADFQHLAAAVAPRPLLVQGNLMDIHWPLSGFEKVKELTRQVYDLYGAGDRCKFTLQHGPHAYAEPFLSKIVSWFAETL